MVGSENRALPQVRDTRVPSTLRSTGLFGSALVISDNNRPETKTVPGAAISAGI